jgi:formylglycine-generating enzyme
MTDFVLSSNEPLVKHYFLHPAFDQYPVVGVSWNQAKAYCAWLTREMNQQRVAKDLQPLPSYRLPTEMEWEFAAREFETKADKTVFAYNLPWKSTTMVDEKGQYRANIKTAPGTYIGDNYEYTAPAKSFAPNSKGLYQMAGNVAEWCEDVFRLNLVEEPATEQAPRQIQLFESTNGIVSEEARVVKGGSWADFQYAALCGSRMGWPQARGSARIGFRVAMSQIGCDCKRTQKCTHIQEF